MAKTTDYHNPSFFVPAVCLMASLLLSSPSSASANASPEQVAMSSLLKKGLEELVEIEISLATGTPKPLKLAHRSQP